MSRSVPEWVGRTDDSVPPNSVWHRLLARQKNICACGCTGVMDPDRDSIDCDHKVALIDGGENRESNLQLMFTEHHRGKTKAENSQRATARRHQAKAFNKPPKRSSFATNRNGKFKKKMNGEVVLR